MTPADRLLQSVVATARHAFGSAACSVAGVDASGEMLVFLAADGEGADHLLGTRIPVSRGIAGWAVASGQAIAVSDVTTDARFDRDTAAKSGYVPSVILAAPMIEGGDALGVIEVLDPRLDADLELLGRFADQAALALALTLDGEGRGAIGAAEEALIRAARDYCRARGL